MPWLFHPGSGRAWPLLALLVVIASCLAWPAGAGELGYSLDSAALLFWQLEIEADDGATGASDTFTFFCCTDHGSVVLGDAVGIVDPTFTPHSLTHTLERTPAPGSVGVRPITLDVSGWLTWTPPSGPSLMTGESAPMETGPLTAAAFLGSLSTPFGTLPIWHTLDQHVGGDTSLRRFSGGMDQGPPHLRLSSVSEVLDSLEVDEADAPGRVEMINPYETLLGTTALMREPGSVSYPLSSAAGLFWEITITADDGVQSPSSDTFFAFATDASLTGDTIGLIDPVFTPQTLVHSFHSSGVQLQVGAHPVTLDLAGSLTWSPPSGPSLMSGQAAPMPTGDATAASFSGTLTADIGTLPFTTDLAAHQGSDMTLLRPSGQSLVPPRLQVSTVAAPLDEVEIDEADESGRVEMNNPYEAVLGATGSVTWSISAKAFFNDAFHTLSPAAPNGTLRNVTWTLRSELVFNDTFYSIDPSVIPSPPSVPALGPGGQLLLGVLLLGAGLAIHRRGRT